MPTHDTSFGLLLHTCLNMELQYIEHGRQDLGNEIIILQLE